MHARYPARKQRQPRNEKIKKENKEQKGGERGKKTKVGARIGTQDTKRSRGKGACNWTAKGTSLPRWQRALRAARWWGAARRGAARRGRCAARHTARHDAGATNETRYTTTTRAAAVTRRVCIFLTTLTHSFAPSRNRAHGVKEHGVHVEPRHDTEGLRSAQSAAARRFPQEGGEAREKARRRRGDRGRPRGEPARGWTGEGDGGGGGEQGERQGQNSLCYRLKFFTGKILIVAFY